MEKLLLFFLVVWFSHAEEVVPIHDSWPRFYPVENCSDFYFKYQQQEDGSFHLYYPLLQESIFNDIPFNGPVVIETMDDLSGIIDIIDEESFNLCITNQPCHLAQDQTLPHFFELASLELWNSRQYCDQIISLLEIENYAEQEILSESPIRRRNLRRALVPASRGAMAEADLGFESADSILDFYMSCGGRRESDVFLMNFTLIQLFRQGVIPDQLSVEEAKALLEPVLSQYDNRKPLWLYRNRARIIQDVLAEITDDVIHIMINKVTSDEVSLDQVRELPAYQDFMRVVNRRIRDKNDYIADTFEYLGLITTPNILLEGMDIIYRDILNEHLASKLPYDWSEEEKANFINGTVIPQTMPMINQCIEQTQAESGYGEGIEVRLEASEQFFEANPEAESFNLFSRNTEVSDIDYLAGCIYPAVSESVDLLIEQLVAGILQESLPEELVNDGLFLVETIDNAQEQLKYCMNEELEVYYGIPLTIGESFNTTEQLARIPQDGFVETLTTCSLLLESDLADDLVVHVVASTPEVSNLFDPNGERITVDGREYLTAVVDLAIDKVEEIFVPCMETDGGSLDICGSIIEQSLIDEVISHELTGVFQSFDFDPSLYQTILTNYETCSENARDNRLNVLALRQRNAWRQDAVSVGLTEEQLELDYSPNYIQCLSETFGETSRLIAQTEFDQLLRQMHREGKISNLEDNLTHGPLLVEEISECFQEPFESMVLISQFKEWSGQEGALDNLMTDCQRRGEAVVIPHILRSEVVGELAPLVEYNLILEGRDDQQRILDETAEDIRELYSLDSDEAEEDLFNWSISQGYLSYLETSSETNLDGFINQVVERIEENTFARVQNNLFAQLALPAAAISNDDFYSRVFISPNISAQLNPSCLQDILMIFAGDKGNNRNPAEDASSESSTEAFDLNQLYHDIINGLYFRYQVSPELVDESILAFGEYCRGEERIENEEQLFASGLIDFVAEYQVQQSVLSEFQNINLNQLAQGYRNILRDRGIEFAESSAFPLELGGDLAFLRNDAEAQMLRRRYEEINHLIEVEIADPARFHAHVYAQNDDIVEMAITVQPEAGSPEMSQLSTMVVNELFRDSNRFSTFGTAFIRSQIETEVGLAGLDQVKNQIRQNYSGRNMTTIAMAAVMDDTPVNELTAIAEELWTADFVVENLNWNRIPPEQRNQLMRLVFEDVIRPQVTGGEENMDRVMDKIDDIINVSPMGGGNSFSDSVEEAITEKVYERYSTLRRLGNLF